MSEPVPCAADEARDVVENVVRIGLLDEELHVGVEEISLCHVDPLQAKLMDKPTISWIKGLNFQEHLET